ncbi:MAG: hypothetical protein Q9167_006203 [Letrouitia subvulpina]
MASLQSSFSQARSRGDLLYVGAVKSNIGHSVATSGVASLIKIVLVLEKAMILGNIWFETLNNNINGTSGLIRIPTAPVSWPVNGLRRASISSYGFGGANAHAILDDACGYLAENGFEGAHQTVKRVVSDGGQNMTEK